MSITRRTIGQLDAATCVLSTTEVIIANGTNTEKTTMAGVRGFVTETLSTFDSKIEFKDKIGIGTGAPNEMLTVVGNVSATGTIFAPTLETDIEATDFVVTNGLSADGNTFTVNASTNKVGIGTSSPGRSLHVKTSTNDEDGQHPLKVEGSSTGTTGERSAIIEIKAGDDASFTGIDFGDSTAAHPGSIVYNHSNNSMIFDTNDATRMTIDSSGNITIPGNLASEGSTTVSDLSVTGNLSATGTADFGGKIKTTSVADAGAPNDNAASIRTSGGAAIEKQLQVGSNAYIYGHQNICGNSTIEGNSTLGYCGGLTLICGNHKICGNSTIMGDLSVKGDFTCIETQVATTSALSITNLGTGPALHVCQGGSEPIAHFIDKNGDDIIFDDDGKVGLGVAAPSEKLTVSGNLSSSGCLQALGGISRFAKTRIFPDKGRALWIKSTNPSNPAASAYVQGPVTVGHDLFKRSGFTDGFADGSNHFHDLTDINLIEQQPEGPIKNTERVQERYYANPGNPLPNNNSVFWAWHRVARTIDNAVVDTSTAVLNVSALTLSTNRHPTDQILFSLNSSPAGKSENLIISNMPGHSFNVGDQVRMEFSQSFTGPIVAAALFGEVTEDSSDRFSVALFGGNYKTTNEVLSTIDQSALTFDEVTLETIGTSTIVNQGDESNLQLYSKSNFSVPREKDEVLKATWTSNHNLFVNDPLTVITDGRGDLVIEESAYVLDNDPDGDGKSILLVYGRRIKQYDLSSFTAFGSTNWTIHRGSLDGIHKDTLGDNLINFNANNKGIYNSYQIGPGTQTDSGSAIAIGLNVYNKDDNTIKIGYNNTMLDIRSDSVAVSGDLFAQNRIVTNDISSSGSLSAGGTSPNYFNGKVGIGTNAPENKLHIVETNAGSITYPLRIQNDDANNNSGVGIEFGISTNDTFTNARIQATREDSEASAELAFQTRVDASTNLTERMRIDRNGNVGIGTTLPARVLHIKDTVNPAGIKIEGSTNSFSEIIFSDTSDEGAISYDHQTDKLNFNNTSTRMTIDSNGNVGIGTTSPNKTLTVIGDISASGSLEIGGDLIIPEKIVHQSDPSAFLRFGTNADTFAITTCDVERLHIGPAGNVGMGSNPAAVGTKNTLHINDSTDGAAIRLGQMPTTSDTLSSASISYKNSEGLQIGTIGNTNLFFETADTTAMTINTDQNVGIGTINPNKKLTVVGDISGNSRAIIGCFNVATGVRSSVIGGDCNTVAGIRSSIGGGFCNNITSNGAEANIAGGCKNTVRAEKSFIGGGSYNLALSANTIIGGGIGNRACGKQASIGGGCANIASGIGSTIAGGSLNQASKDRSFIGGGCQNSATGQGAAIVGGDGNTASGDRSFVGGGISNKAQCINSTIAGGVCNTTSGFRSFVGGGCKNTSSGGNSTIAGGNLNKASGARSFIGGGLSLSATGQDSAVAGGVRNKAQGTRSFIGGGCENTASNINSTIAGGVLNTANGFRSTVGGGNSNRASGNTSTVVGGLCNVTNGEFSGILGGSNNTLGTAADKSFIIGSNITADAACTTFVNNLSTTGDANISNKVGIGTSNVSSDVKLEICGSAGIPRKEGGYMFLEQPGGSFRAGLSSTNPNNTLALRGGTCFSMFISSLAHTSIGAGIGSCMYECFPMGLNGNNRTDTSANGRNRLTVHGNAVIQSQKTAGLSIIGRDLGDDPHISSFLTLSGYKTRATGSFLADGNTEFFLGRPYLGSDKVQIGYSCDNCCTGNTVRSSSPEKSLVTFSVLSATALDPKPLVGIGTTAPNNPLTVVGNISGSNSLFLSNSAHFGGENAGTMVINGGIMGAKENCTGIVVQGGDTTCGAGCGGSIELYGPNMGSSHLNNYISYNASEHVFRDEGAGTTILTLNPSTNTSTFEGSVVVDGTLSAHDGIIALRDVDQSSDKTITASGNNLTFDAVHGIFGYSIGLRGNRGSVLGMESAGTDLDISAPGDITLTPSGNDVSVTGNLEATGTITSTNTTVSRPIQNNEADTNKIRNIRQLTQIGYNALSASGGPDTSTMYVIIG